MKGQFPTTQWAVLRQAAVDSPAARQALERLCAVYWFPIYTYVRRQGFNREDARDLTQQFFVQFLECDYVTVADRRRGKFRTFLLTCLKHFLADEWDKMTSAKRGGNQSFLPWEIMASELEMECEDASSPAADKVYDTQWALTVTETAVRTLRDRFLAAGKEKEFHSFKPFLVRMPENGDYASLAGSETGSVPEFRNCKGCSTCLPSGASSFWKRWPRVARRPAGRCMPMC